MRFFILIPILVLSLFVQASNKKEQKSQVTKRAPSTVSEFESRKDSYQNKKEDIVQLKRLAEKYYTLFKPNVHELVKYYSSIQSYLPVHLKKQVADRMQIYQELNSSLSSKKSNDYLLAQKVLSLKVANSSAVQADYDILALSLIESYFKKTKAEQIKEEAWGFRMNLRQRVDPEQEFAIIPKYLSIFPKSAMAKSKARYLRDYIISDYRPMSGELDFSDFSIKEVERLIESVLSE